MLPLGHNFLDTTQIVVWCHPRVKLGGKSPQKLPLLIPISKEGALHQRKESVWV
jgi:hypothetical protein